MGSDAVAECRLQLLSAPMQGGKARQAADIFHQAENKLGGGRNWAIFQSAGTQSIQTEASQPLLYMKHPLAIAQHNTTAQPRHRYPLPPRASDSPWKPLAVQLEANQTAAIPVTPHLVATVWHTHGKYGIKMHERSCNILQHELLGHCQEWVSKPLLLFFK